MGVGTVDAAEIFWFSLATGQPSDEEVLGIPNEDEHEENITSK